LGLNIALNMLCDEIRRGYISFEGEIVKKFILCFEGGVVKTCDKL